MELGMVGLGRMGGAMALRLLRGGHRVVAHDLSRDAVQAAASKGAVAALALNQLVSSLSRPRVIWLMLPQGEPTGSTMDALIPLLARGDIVIDGGNANYKDTLGRVPRFEAEGIEFLDCGTSGGIWGLEGGYSLMVGGSKAAFQHIEPILQTLAPASDKGYGHVGPHGAGHFTKMVHNAVEYGLMQAYVEGFEVLAAKQEFALDLAAISNIWSHGSVVKSWLLERVSDALHDPEPLDKVKAYVEDTGEGRWMVKEAIDLAIPAPVLTLALFERFRSRYPDAFSHKLLARLRNIFGGHEVRMTDGR
ncbi:MAG: 6-phosphogluconate dehydrogenase [Dehalococcoidia bacterium]|nr:6-phosphogluconate dehydrogenase [Dehalococcoidia bacterium]